MSRIDLLRHGETTGGAGFRGSLDDELSETGWLQMRAAVVGRGPWDRLIASPRRRCADFAAELAEQLAVPLVLEPDLRELHFGAWEGRTAADLMATDEAALGAFWRDPYSFTPPDGEPLMRFEVRVLAAMRRLCVSYGGQRLLIVGHAGVMRLLLARQQRLPRARLLEVEVGHASLHAFDSACLEAPCLPG